MMLDMLSPKSGSFRVRKYPCSKEETPDKILPGVRSYLFLTGFYATQILIGIRI